MSLPLVSCIMPTKNRREFVPKAIEYFLRQTYPNKELVIVNDGEPVHDLIDTDAVEHALIHYAAQSYEHFSSLGAKRNNCVQRARGDLIAHWDDDDWYGPTRLADQVSAIQKYGVSVTGVNSPIFYDLRTGHAYRFFVSDECMYGATLMYTRDFWTRRPFADVQVGETESFLSGRYGYALRDSAWFVGMIHDGNTCPKALNTKYYSPVGQPCCTRSDLLAIPLSSPAAFSSDSSFYQGLREKMGVTA